MKTIDLSIACRESDIDVTGYLPFDGAEFCAHRLPPPKDMITPPNAEWVVTHVRTGLAILYTICETRKTAIAIADTLSRECPTASEIERGGARGGAVGPVFKLEGEVRKALGFPS